MQWGDKGEAYSGEQHAVFCIFIRSLWMLPAGKKRGREPQHYVKRRNNFKGKRTHWSLV